MPLKSVSQTEIINNFNSFIDVAHGFGILNNLNKINEDGVCNGLTYSYKLYAHQHQREEYILSLMFIASLTNKTRINKILEAYQTAKQNGKKYHLNIENYSIDFEKILIMLEGIHASQNNQSLQEIGILWDKNYDFMCTKNNLAKHLKQMNWQEGQSAFISIVEHVFYVEKTNKEFYLFESNNIDTNSLSPNLKDEHELAQQILYNLDSIIVNEYVAFNAQFVSYANKSNRFLEDAMDEFDNNENELKNYHTIKLLYDDYGQKKISRLNCALAILEEIGKLEKPTEKMKQLSDTISKYFREEEQFINGFLNYNEDAVTKTAYEYSISLLFIAVKYNNIKLVEKLLNEEHIQVNKATNGGITPLYNACQQGHIDIVKMLLSYPNIDVNTVDLYGSTPLYIACDNNHSDVVKMLLSHPNIDVNTVNLYGATPLHIACQIGNIEIVKALLNHPKIEASIDIKMNGFPPLYIACVNGHTEIAKTLLAQYSDIDIDALFHLSCQHGHVNVIKTLKQCVEIDVNKTNNESTSFLIDEAKQNARGEVFERILRLKNENNIPEQLSFTPLHAAIFKGHKKTVTQLLKLGADINATTNGIFCLELAKIMNHKEIELILKNKLVKVQPLNNIPKKK